MFLFGLVLVTEPDRMENFARSYEAREVETGAAIFANNCQSCHGEAGQGVPGKGPSLNVAELLVAPEGEALPTRLKDIAWSGSIENFIRGTIASGRPRASGDFSEYPERMPTWGEANGGPLRTDQIEALTAFIMNWRWQYLDANGKPLPQVVEIIDAAGTDITLELPAGDAANGEQVAEKAACTACHITAPVGPAWLASASADGQGIGTRAEERIADAEYGGAATTAEQYLFESIVSPSVYLVPGESYVVAATGQSVMASTFGTTLSKQDVADLIAYMLTLK
jgi:mono/diheme cytochrome c family protein